jgi:hypothetical protein
MLAYKGFDRALKCRRFQYAIGESYVEEAASLCNKGFHACLDPVDVLNYYPPATSRYCIVEIDGVDERREDDTKICGTKLTVVRELTVAEFIKTSAEYTRAEVAKAIGDGPEKAQSSGDRAHAQSSGDRAHAQSSGYRAHAQSSGDSAHAQSSGDSAHAQSSGDSAHAQSSGDSAHAQSSGDSAHAQSSGDSAHAQSSGDRAHAQSSGDRAHAQSSGYRAHAQSSGKHAIAASLGIYGTARVEGDAEFIVLAECDNNYNLIAVRVGRVGAEIERGKAYRLSGGAFVEVAT